MAHPEFAKGVETGSAEETSPLTLSAGCRGLGSEESLRVREAGLGKCLGVGWC